MLRLATRRASQRLLVRHSSKTASTPAPAPSPPSDSIHSSDIAFKPNNDGWGGGNPAYASNYDRIFGNKNGSTKQQAPEPAAPQPTAQALDARDALALRRILRESGESSALAEILEESGWRRS